MVIDFHVHVFPDDLAQIAVPKLAHSAQSPAYLDGTINALLESMDQAGIDQAVIQPVATKPEQVESINRWLATIRSPRLATFAAFFPGSEKWEQDLELIRELGFPGIKLHPDYQQFFVDDEELFPIYERIFEEGLYLLFHAGIDIGLPPPVHCTPQGLRKVVDTFGGEKIIAAHLGGWQMWEQVEEYLLGEPLYLDTSFSISYLGASRTRALLKAHDPQKLLFATDSPWAPQLSCLGQLRGLDLEPELEALILGENGARILGGFDGGT